MRRIADAQRQQSEQGWRGTSREVAQRFRIIANSSISAEATITAQRLSTAGASVGAFAGGGHFGLRGGAQLLRCEEVGRSVHLHVIEINGSSSLGI